MLRSRTATTANHVHQLVVQVNAHESHHVFGRVVVTAELVRQPRIRVTANVAGRDLAHTAQVRHHAVGTETAVEADGKRVHVHHAHGECFYRLARKCSARGVAHRHGEHDFDRLEVGGIPCSGCIGGAFFHHFSKCTGGGLRVQCIKNRFNQDGVDAFIHQHLNLFQVGVFEFVESNASARGVVHVFAHREHFARGAHVAQNVHLAAVLFHGLRRGLLCNLHGGAVHFGNAVFLVVFVLAHALARERIGGQAVHARIHIASLNIENDIRLFDGEHVVVRALDAVCLDYGTHAAVQQQHLVFKSLA